MIPSTVVIDLTLPHNAPECKQAIANTSHDAQFSLRNKTIVITGGGRGLGNTLAAAAREAGGNVACLDILSVPSQAEWVALEQTAKQSNLKLWYHKCDITDEEKLEQVMNEIAAD